MSEHVIAVVVVRLFIFVLGVVVVYFVILLLSLLGDIYVSLGSVGLEI